MEDLFLLQPQKVKNDQENERWVQRCDPINSSGALFLFKVVLEEFLTLKAWIRKEKKFCWDNIQKIRSMETQDNGFLLVIDGVRKEKERLTADQLRFNDWFPKVLISVFSCLND